MESALHNFGSATESMNCPKCGYAQEKRLDCKKCGVVFSKYYALFPSSKSPDTTPSEASNGQELSGQNLRTMLSGLQAQIQVLSNRFAEIEFEKAERNQLRLDLKNLERQLFENLGHLENQLKNTSAPQIQQETIDSHLPEVHERLEQVENKLGSFDFAGQYMVELSEKGEASSRKISDLQQQASLLHENYEKIKGQLETQISVLHEDFEKIKSQLEIIAQAQKVEEPRTPLEEDVHVIRQNLDEFRTFLSKHTTP